MRPRRAHARMRSDASAFDIDANHPRNAGKPTRATTHPRPTSFGGSAYITEGEMMSDDAEAYHTTQGKTSPFYPDDRHPANGTLTSVYWSHTARLIVGRDVSKRAGGSGIQGLVTHPSRPRSPTAMNELTRR